MRSAAALRVVASILLAMIAMAIGVKLPGHTPLEQLGGIAGVLLLAFLAALIVHHEEIRP